MAFARRERDARAWSRCRVCEAELADPVGTNGRCSGCKKIRYCGAPCQKDDWSRHRAECKAWRAEAEAATIAAGGCPLGDYAAQEAAVKKAMAKPLAALRAGAAGGDLAAQCVLGSCFLEGGEGFPQDDLQALTLLRRAASGNLAAAQTQLGTLHDRGVGGLAIDHSEAFRLYLLAARQGDATAQNNCGVKLRDGDGVSQDLASAFSFFRQAAEQGHADAQAAVAKAFAQGRGVACDYAEALKWARRSAEQRNRFGENILGLLHEHGWGVPVNHRVAATYHARAAAQGSEPSKRSLYTLATKGVTEATTALHSLGIDAPLRAADAALVAAGRCPVGDLAAQTAALERWVDRPFAAIRAAAEGGDLIAMEALGECYESGLKGAPTNLAEALAWFRRGAAGLVVQSQCNLGVMHRDGMGGLVRNDTEALRLFRLAADAGSADARFSMGLRYDHGRGVPEDKAEAVRLWKLADSQGHAGAQACLASAYRTGAGVAVDFAAALHFARRSADQGEPIGAYHAGCIFDRGGEGVAADKREAVKYYAKGAEKGHGGCVDFLRRLAFEGVPEAAAALRRLRLAPA